MDRPCFPTSERDGLAGLLDQQRAALVRKVSGLTEVDARRTPTVSSLSPLSLLKHCTVWEGRWFRGVVAGEALDDGWPDREDDDAEFVLEPGDTLAGWLRGYEEACDVSRAIVAARDLDKPCELAEVVDANVRYVLLHMIEETARHVGHADILREAIDGTRGL